MINILKGPLVIGDVEPFPYFVIERDTIDTITKVVSQSSVDLGTIFTAIKFCARHEGNMQDINDHAYDDIYKNLTYDDLGANGVAHFDWEDVGDNGTDDLIPGRYYVRLEFQRASDGEKYHGSFRGYFDVVDKMDGSFGATT